MKIFENILVLPLKPVKIKENYNWHQRFTHETASYAVELGIAKLKNLYG